MGTRTGWCVLVAVAVGLAAPRPARADHAINAVIGDASARALGLDPERLDEVTRIRVHLRHVLAGLRAREVSALPAPVQARRRAALIALAGYIERGRFPRRTDDGYPGRRPRFIDDRGVYCAVGYLLAATGAEALARAIDADHEYAYLAELRSPALTRWAADHGFTHDELATIQPAYHEPPPGPERTRELIEHAGDVIALRCARRAPPRAQVALRVRGDRRGAVTATTSTPGEFAACVAEIAGQVERPGDAAVRPYQFDLTLTLTEPAVLLERTMDGVGVPRDCAPRPGRLARTATIEVTSDRRGLAVRVTTEPANPEIERCVEQLATARLGEFGAGVWSLHARRTVAVPLRFTDPAVTTSLELAGPTYASRCSPASGAPARVTITARAAPDDPELTIDVDGGDPGFQRCVRELLRSYLRGAYGGSRLVGGEHRPYFRIDAAVHAAVTVEVRPPERPHPR